MPLWERQSRAPLLAAGFFDFDFFAIIVIEVCRVWTAADSGPCSSAVVSRAIDSMLMKEND